jgi:uncharacterized membrane protein (UPF0127 family)
MSGRISIAVPGVQKAEGFRRRLLGWLGRRRPPENEGLLFDRCRCVHTFGMRFAIDVVFLDGGGRVLRVDAMVTPGRMRFCARAASTLELRAGGADALGVLAGATLDLAEVG